MCSCRGCADEPPTAFPLGHCVPWVSCRGPPVWSSLQGDTGPHRQLLLAWLLVLSSGVVWCHVVRNVVSTELFGFIYTPLQPGWLGVQADRSIRETTHHTWRRPSWLRELATFSLNSSINHELGVDAQRLLIRVVPLILACRPVSYPTERVPWSGFVPHQNFMSPQGYNGSKTLSASMTACNSCWGQSCLESLDPVNALMSLNPVTHPWPSFTVRSLRPAVTVAVLVSFPEVLADTILDRASASAAFSSTVPSLRLAWWSSWSACSSLTC